MRAKEHDIQVSCVTWFRLQYPKCLIWAIPNGGQRNVIVASKLKAEGVLSGVPDLFLAVPKNGYAGLFIEMKADRNKPTDVQLTIMQKLENEGYRCVVCYSFDEFRTLVNNYLNL